VNGIRATVSQEAVQEFQMVLSNYNAEYGRATGGVINIVTKSGGNDFTVTLLCLAATSRFKRATIFRADRSDERRIGSGEAAVHENSDGIDAGRADQKRQNVFLRLLSNTPSAKRPDSPASASTTLAWRPFNCGGCGLDGLMLTPDQSAATCAAAGRKSAAAGVGTALCSFRGIGVERGAESLGLRTGGGGLTSGILTPDQVRSFRFRWPAPPGR
jgi:hypothetical protein